MKRIVLTAFMAALVIILPAVASAGSAMSQMATMVINLNHYPTTDEKKALAEILADEHSTEGEKLIAGALMRMQHRVEGMDVEKLSVFAFGDSGTFAERELADVLLGIAHHPTQSDIKRIKAAIK